MDELARWLGKQLDEEEKAAFTAGHTLAGELALRWEAVSAYVYPAEVTDNEPPVASADLMSDMPGYEVARARALHIAAHDPDRVMGEIKAKREVVRLAERAHDYAPTFTSGFAAALEQVLRLYALAYKDRPGYAEAIASIE